jgi:hypothetical protein
MGDNRRRGGASPVTITVRTPSVFSSVTRAAESSRAGSLSAINPMSCIAAGGPAATASTRKPFASSSFAAAAAVGEGAAIATDDGEGALDDAQRSRLGSVAVASDIFVAGSKGLK